MALVQYSIPVQRISGRTGSQQVGTWNGGQPVFREFVRPSNPGTADQAAIRSAFTAGSQQWGTVLTESQRNAWTTWANTHTVTNRLGNVVSRGGLSAYMELAILNFLRTGTWLSSAPTLVRPSGSSGITDFTSAIGTDTDLTISVEHSYVTLTGLYLVTRITPQTSGESRKPALSDYRMVQGVGASSFAALAASGSTYNFPTARYSEPDAGWGGVEVQIVNAEGWASAAFRQFDQWTAA